MTNSLATIKINVSKDSKLRKQKSINTYNQLNLVDSYT